MNRSATSWALLALTWLAASPAEGKPSTPPIKSFTAKVIAVADGDTITLLHDRKPTKIRLHGVDCPEKAQPFGQKAKQFTSKLVFGKAVRVKVVTIDKYGRTVAEVFVGERSLGEELVKAGMAWWYKKYARRAKMLAVLQDEAREAKRGLWADPNPTPPWTYRYRGKPFHGNVKSRVFHAPRCRYYNCKNCTMKFKTVEEAVKAGYQPHGACVKTSSPSPL